MTEDRSTDRRPISSPISLFCDVSPHASEESLQSDLTPLTDLQEEALIEEPSTIIELESEIYYLLLYAEVLLINNTVQISDIDLDEWSLLRSSKNMGQFR